jgi:iron-sulfur cluster insertion protein
MAEAGRSVYAFDASRRWLLDWSKANFGREASDTMNTAEGTAEAWQETPALLFTDAAARKVSDLILGEGNPNLMLRVFVQGGGCSGLQYGFEFDEVIQEGDTCVENLGVKLLVDPMSVQYLSGAEIDYREGLEGAQFVIRNPNATTTCGCGSSFSAA